MATSWVTATRCSGSISAASCWRGRSLSFPAASCIRYCSKHHADRTSEVTRDMIPIARSALGAAALAAASLPSLASAQTAEEFYRGRTITMYVGTGVGAGAVSSYPMALAQVIKKYIPGSPNIVVSHMPGAGGIKAATYIESIAPQDGTAWGFITRGFMLAPLLKMPQANFNPPKFNWIGSPSRTVSMGLAWNASTDVRTIQGTMQKGIVVGATSIGQDTGIFP